jgi:hypothetical protein
MPLLGVVIFAIGLLLVYSAFTDTTVGDIVKVFTSGGNAG